MTVRDERAAALIRRHRDLSDDFTRALPGLLDDLEAIDRAQVPTGVIKFDGTLTPEQEAEFRAEFYRRAGVPEAAPAEQPAAPAKPAPRRRPAR